MTIYSTILVALDGSHDSLAGADLALKISKKLKCRLLAAHVYDARIHDTRFREMEPGLPPEYRQEHALKKLRKAHDSLMTDGFQAMSKGYMEEFISSAQQSGVNVEEVAVAARNYVGILQLIREHGVDLVVLGATGLGAQRDGMLGSTATRVLRGASCDVLISRHMNSERIGPALVGVDGSNNALTALRKGSKLASHLGMQLHVAAAYDVAFHHTVFKTMANSFSADRQREIGLDKQEALHGKLIDESLAALYQDFLERAAQQATSWGGEPVAKLIRGKAYRALTDYAGESHADLVVLGRFGHNREEVSDIGSNAEAVVRLSPCSVLVTVGEEKQQAVEQHPQSAQLDWDPEALARLERVPSFAQSMARQGVEDYVRSVGKSRVTAPLFQEAAQRFGMIGGSRSEEENGE